MAAPVRKPQDVLRQAREDKFDAWFKDRRWRVAEEMTGTRTFQGATITYDSGEFWVDPPAKFLTPLGHPGRHGFVIVEVAPDGSDLEAKAAFGDTALKVAAERYGAIINLPERRRAKPVEQS
jgi:hypothetical protein